MNESFHLKQDPHPGRHMVLFRGDTVTFVLTLSAPETGEAWLRTNIGYSEIARREIIDQVERDIPPLSKNWYDIPMEPVDDLRYEVTLGLSQVGHFEGKCFFLRKGDIVPDWPEGYNAVINVKPAQNCGANIIYNAFVRQFGPNRGKTNPVGEKEGACVQMLDERGYVVIPESGTFRDVIGELDFIIGKLGCNILQLLPVHPTPTTYGRMGRFGSPYAAQSFTAVDPAQAEFDRKATPMEQFLELIDAVHKRSGRVIIDITPNHTGWGARIHEEHPEWLVRDERGQIEVPGAWGVLWEDLTKLDFSKTGLWKYMADVLLTWCQRGVDGFRCDAGYMIPVSTWKYIVSRVREQFPDTLFLLEGLGGKIEVTRQILSDACFDFAYSELFQNYDRGQIEWYFQESIQITESDGVLVHFAETHDNPRLAAVSKTYAKMRTALCALFCQNGAFAFTNGVEWYATEKIDVHQARSLNWGSEENQVDHIRRLNLILKTHPAFYDGTELKMIQEGSGNFVVLHRYHLPTRKSLIVAVNLDCENPATVTWNQTGTGIKDSRLIDLITGKPVRTNRGDFESTVGCFMEAGEVFCLTDDPADLEIIENADRRAQHENDGMAIPDPVADRLLRAKCLEIYKYFKGDRGLGDFDPQFAAKRFEENPESFIQEFVPKNNPAPLVRWQWPEDLNREVMIPDGCFLMIRSNETTPFHVRILYGKKNVYHEKSLPDISGVHFTVLHPFEGLKISHEGNKVSQQLFISLELEITTFEKERNRRQTSALLLLPEAGSVFVKSVLDRFDIHGNHYLFLGTNGRGGMLRADLDWGKLESKYDGLLAANDHPEYPVDRRMLFTRCRGWVVYQGYSIPLSGRVIDRFDYTSGENAKGFWKFHIPSGQGEHICMTIGLGMVPGQNAIEMTFYRHPSKGVEKRLSDDKPIRLVLRPDIEDRNFHEVTKAYTGPESHWPKSVETVAGGFVFFPSSTPGISIRVSPGEFVFEPEWQYMLHHFVEENRGMDPYSDLFSPGYFQATVYGNDVVYLKASGEKEETDPDKNAISGLPGPGDCLPADIKESVGPVYAMKKALKQYVVKREAYHTVIAGYPWFLDWGRDTLIVIRGLIAAGFMKESESILIQFGRFEENGTLPNMIRGEDARNRNTSDAPLWFFAACSDFVENQGNEELLERKSDGRSIREILISMGHSLMKGTPNGMYMDAETGLLFSPVHFTWMDTNHPAGTPREGYPIEIQALWHFALTFLSRINPDAKKWKKTAEKVEESIRNLFFREEDGYLSDCIHAGPGEPPKKEAKDDALRPNQLLAVTMNAITDKSKCRRILRNCESLLVPGAIRSLADRPLKKPLEIRRGNELLSNPHYPYRGRYEGDEDTSRKPAYHNGTAWTWMFPLYSEAWVKVYGEAGVKTALSWLTTCFKLMNEGCLGHIPEILDGDYPHKQRGCDAQAWGVSEVLRVWKWIENENEQEQER